MRNLKNRGKTLRRIILDRAHSLTMDLATGELSVVDREPSYREGALSIMGNANPAERNLVYLEAIKEAHEMSDGTKRKLRKVLKIAEFGGIE